jgi:hypothetical protein
MGHITFPDQYYFSGGYVGLHYPLHRIAPSVEIDGEKLLAKLEFHLSIFSVKRYAPRLAEKISISVEEAERRIIVESGKLLSRRPLRIRFKDELRLAEESGKKTIVIMCAADGIEEFFIDMRRAFGLDIPTQPTHMTLYTRADGLGIGLVSEQEVNALTRSVTAQESESIKKAIRFVELVID